MTDECHGSFLTIGEMSALSHTQALQTGADGTSAVGTITMSKRCPAPVVLPYRVLIVDDVPSTRRIVWAVLESRQEFDVVGEASDGRAAVEMAALLQPDLVLLDVSMPFLDGPKALKGVLQGAPNARVIIFSGVNPTKGARLVDTGAIGFIEKGITPIELLERVGEILTDSSTVVLDPAVFDELRTLMGSSGEDLLTGLVNQFVQDTEAWLLQLRAAIDVKDTSALGRIAHSIKGGAAQLGGRRLASSCSRLEERSTTGSLSDCRIDLGAVEDDYLELRHELAGNVALPD